MRVDVRLYATFVKYAPTQHAGDPFEVELEDSASLTDLIRKLGIPENDVHLAIVNGRIIHDRMQSIQNGDRVALFPPVGGG
ncbi:MAG: MoaD/ThiS family protein [Candidatus Bipolaricaulota bacterium]